MILHNYYFMQVIILAKIFQDQKLNDLSFPLHLLLTKDQVANVLPSLKNGTATAIDGIPYKVINYLHHYIYKILNPINPPLILLNASQ